MSQAVAQLRTKISKVTRNAVCGIPTYWPKPVFAVNHLVDLLETHGLLLEDDYYSLNVDSNGEGRVRLSLVDDEGVEMPSMLIVMWYRMPSGERFEITAYLT